MSGRRRGGRDRAPLPDFVATSSQWLPVVQQLRPHTSWIDVAKELKQSDPDRDWTGRKPTIAVRQLVSQGLASLKLLRWSSSDV
jgi:hypothetical protein